MSGKLLLTCLLVIIGLSLSESASSRDLYNYMRKVDILRDLLEAEGCEDPIIKGLQRREVIGAPGGHDFNLEVNVQRELYRQLKVVLLDCQGEKKDTSGKTKATTTTSTTTTTTKITSPTTTAPTTTKATTPTTTTRTTIPSTSTSWPTTTPVPTECQTAQNLTEGWRQDHKGSDIKPKNGNYNCDSKEMIANGRPWFRFSGAAGNRLMNKCVPIWSCGTGAALWSDDTMPTQVGVIAQANAYGQERGNCRYHGYTQKISVVRCSTSPHDFVYRFDGKDTCLRGFCGMTA